MSPDERPTGLNPGADALRRKIEQMRSLTGHPLRCDYCDRLSSGRATGWTMRHGGDRHVYALCPECGELEFG